MTIQHDFSNATTGSRVPKPCLGPGAWGTNQVEGNAEEEVLASCLVAPSGSS